MQRWQKPGVYLIVIKQYGIHNVLRFCLITDVFFTLLVSLCFWITQSHWCVKWNLWGGWSAVSDFRHSPDIYACMVFFFFAVILNLFFNWKGNVQQNSRLKSWIYCHALKKQKSIIKNCSANCIVNAEQKHWAYNSRCCCLSLNLEENVWFPFLHSQPFKGTWHAFFSMSKCSDAKNILLWRPAIRMITGIVLVS